MSEGFAHRGRPLCVVLFVCLMLAAGPAARAGLTINLNPAAGTTPEGLAAFQMAAARWEALITTDITVNIDIQFGPLDNDWLGAASATKQTALYHDVQTALVAGATSADDLAASGTLAPGYIVHMLINRTSNSPHGPGSEIPYVDGDPNQNNLNMQITSANAKALGIRAAADPASDGSITFNSNFDWDTDPTDGIDPNLYDLVGAAGHEMGHILGFTSGVDVLDAGAVLPDSDYPYVMTMDLFRYSAESTAEGVIDWTADDRSKYMSFDGGVTSVGEMATGVNFGDGRTCDHWKEDLFIGIMDPTLARGEEFLISQTDLRGFDVIGYGVGEIPEPATVMFILLAGCAASIRRRRVIWR
jgi:hypothetical protein